MSKQQLKLLLLIPLPALALGSVAMYLNGLPTSIWVLNSIGYLLAVIVSILIIKKPIIIDNPLTLPISIILLGLTFIDSGLDHVHRWLSIGPIRLNIASIVLPIIIIRLGALVKTADWWITALISLGVSILLFFQPDASQASGFIIPMIIMVFSRGKIKVPSIFISGVLIAIMVLSWKNLDTLPPVDHVEGILIMVSAMGTPWFILGIASLVILPLPFIVFPPHGDRLPSICLGIYFSVVLISTVFGNFPVPVMGYGISPILGYTLAMAWLVKETE